MYRLIENIASLSHEVAVLLYKTDDDSIDFDKMCRVRYLWTLVAEKTFRVLSKICLSLHLQPSIGYHLLDVPFITALKSKFMHSSNQINHNIKL